MSTTLPKEIRSILVDASPDRGKHLASTIEFWLRNNGPDWTSKRIKTIFLAAKAMRSGDASRAKALLQSESIAYRVTHGVVTPKGQWGAIAHRFISGSRQAVVTRALICLRVYTYFISKLTEKHMRKGLESIVAPYSGSMKALTRYSTWVRYLEICRSLNIKVTSNPNMGRMKGMSKTFSPVPIPDDLREELGEEPYFYHVWSILTSPYVPTLKRERHQLYNVNKVAHFGNVLPTVLEEQCSLRTQSGEGPVPGKIVFLPERGCKTRVVAQPTALNQLVFMPLHEALDKAMSKVDEICVHDQNQGLYFLREALDNGITTHCFDLSSATDRYPLEMQTALLDENSLFSYSEWLEYLSRESKWKVPGLDTEVSYTVGQPMGLFGSFPLFTLSHWALIKACEGYVEAQGEVQRIFGKSFMVLGDDVIIIDPGVAKQYELAMRRLGVELSPLKTIVSDKLGEFAGGLCFRTKRGAAVVRPFKFSRRGNYRKASYLISLMRKPVRFDRLLSKNLPPKSRRRIQRQLEIWERCSRNHHYTRWFRNPDLSPLVKLSDSRGASGNVPLGKVASLVLACSRRSRLWYSMPFGGAARKDTDEASAIAMELLDQQNSATSSLVESLPGNGWIRPQEGTENHPVTLEDDPLLGSKGSFLHWQPETPQKEEGDSVSRGEDGSEPDEGLSGGLSWF